MSYPWTRVPTGEPPLDRLQLRLLPVADLFMALMWSRPGGLSLRSTWVTPATIALSLGVAVGGGLSGLAAVAYGVGTRSLLVGAAGAVAVGLAAGAGSVALFGFRQHRLVR